MILLLATAIAAPAPPLAPGRYGLVIQVATVADTPWFTAVRGSSTSRAIVELDYTASGLRQRQRVCAVSIDGRALARIEVPPAFVAALPERDLSVATPGDGYVVDLGLDVVGFEGDGPLPTSIAGTTDWDGDGHPAATIRLHLPAFGAAELYVVQAARLVLTGVRSGEGVDGTVTVGRFEQATLDARPAWLAMQTRVRVDETRSWFRLRPLPDGAGCEEIPTKR